MRRPLLRLGRPIGALSVWLAVEHGAAGVLAGAILLAVFFDQLAEARAGR